MRNTTKWIIAVLLFLSAAITVSSAAVLSINTPSYGTKGETLTVTVLWDVAPAPGADVYFVLDGGTPSHGQTDASGQVKYKPLLTGNLNITAIYEGITTGKEISVYEPTPTPQPPSGGGGAGGGGVVSAEPYENILKYITLTGSLMANTSVLYNFGARPEWTPDISIYEMPVTGRESENDISIRVEILKGTSKLVTASPPGAVYRNINIWAGSKRIKEALIRFRVNNSWLDNSGQAGSDIKMLRWDGSRWTQLVTAVLSKDPDFTYFEARTEAFSPFAVSGLKGVVVPAAGPEVTVTAGPEVTVTVPPPSAKPPGMAWLYVLIIIVVIAIAAYYLYTAAQKKEKK
jgi:PGF-pre-PGF domain-containing protein